MKKRFTQTLIFVGIVVGVPGVIMLALLFVLLFALLNLWEVSGNIADKFLARRKERQPK